MKQNTLSYKIRQYLMFAGPGTVLFLAVVIVPFLYGLYLTLTSWDGVSATKPFVGFENFAAAFQDSAYWSAMGRTVIYSVFAVVLINIVAFALAYLVTQGIKGQNFFRAGFFVPNLIGGIVLGYVWKFVFNRAFVALFSGTSLLSTTNGAMFCLILVSVWQYAGYMMLIYVAGFMSVSGEVREAAMTEEPNGSPFVNDRFTSYTTKQRVMLRNRHCTKLARIRGTVTFHMVWDAVQPSMLEASFTSSETLMKPAT